MLVLSLSYRTQSIASQFIHAAVMLMRTEEEEEQLAEYKVDVEPC